MYFLVSCFVFFFTFYRNRRKLDQEGLLDPSNHFDIMCLHLCVGHVLSAFVDDFLEGWNRHPVRTEGIRSPLQMFYVGFMELARDEMVHSELIQVLFEITLHQYYYTNIIIFVIFRMPLIWILPSENLSLFQNFTVASRGEPAIVTSYNIPLLEWDLKRLQHLIRPEMCSFENLREKFVLTKNFVPSVTSP